jgi:Uma2 family endonuclease
MRGCAGAAPRPVKPRCNIVAMGAAATTLLTFEEFERLPDRPGKRELLKGEPIEWPPPEFNHNDTSHEIYHRLYTALAEAHARGQAPDLGKVYIEMGYKLMEGWVQPDVSVTYAGQTVGKYLEGAPAIVIEVVSPNHTAQDLDVKTELYFQFGAREVWRVYPKTKHVVVQVNGASRVVPEHESVTTPLLPGLALSVVDILGA